MNNKVVPIFFACDENFIKFTYVTMKSIMENASKNYEYHLYIMNTGISYEKMEVGYKILEPYSNARLQFIDCTSYIKKVQDRLPLRDYYSNATYYRLFIADMFQEYEKAIYIDSDTVVLGDIAKLYSTELGDNLVGACHEQAMVQNKIYGDYVETNLGIDRNKFFNAGLLLINLEAFRNECVLDQFTDIVSLYECKVTQDEDYLNIICEGRVRWITDSWNTEVYGEIKYKDSEINMIHYIMWSKPWHFYDVRLESYFWKYCKMTPYFNEIRDILSNYTDEQRKRDLKAGNCLRDLAIKETNKEVKWVDVKSKRKSIDRLEILAKIRKYETEGKFDLDVEQDPPTRPLKPGEVDYTKKKIRSKLKTRAAYFIARRYLNSINRTKKMIVKDIIGTENLANLESGAILTCNHFNAFDSFAIQMAYEASCDMRKKKFYRVIREGNYTSFPGFFGFLMRNCYTLPLASNPKVLKEFVKSTNEILKRGDLVLVYPEQSMWWNYRKPKPLKKGAFQFAVNNNVPVVPCFITMEDSDIVGPDGFNIQEYTIHIMKPIYPDPLKSKTENIDSMMDKNFQMWKRQYEASYGRKLEYITAR